jgi:hypothetical protein
LAALSPRSAALSPRRAAPNVPYRSKFFENVER